MGEGVMNVGGETFVKEILGDSQPVFYKNQQIGVYPLFDSIEVDEDNIPLKGYIQKKNGSYVHRRNGEVYQIKTQKKAFH